MKLLTLFESRYVGCNPTAVLFEVQNPRYPNNVADVVRYATASEAAGGNTSIHYPSHGLQVGDFTTLGKVIRADANNFVTDKIWDGNTSVEFKPFYYGYETFLKIYDKDYNLLGEVSGAPNFENVSTIDVAPILRSQKKDFIPFKVAPYERYLVYNGTKYEFLEMSIGGDSELFYAINGSPQPQYRYGNNFGEYVISANNKGKPLSLFEKIPKFNGLHGIISLVIEPNSTSDVIVLEDNVGEQIYVPNIGAGLYHIEFNFTEPEYVILKINGTQVSDFFEVESKKTCSPSCFLEWKNHLGGLERYVFEGLMDTESTSQSEGDGKVWIEDRYSEAEYEYFEYKLKSRLSYTYRTSGLRNDELFAISEITRSLHVFHRCKMLDDCGSFIGYSKSEIIPERGNYFVSKNSKKLFEFSFKAKSSFEYRTQLR